MKLIIVIMTAFMVQVSASTLAQNITLKADNISLREAFREIKKQTGYLVVYKTNVINGKPKVDVDLSNVPLEKAMGEILKDQDLEFSIRYNSVMIKEKEKPSFLDRVVDALTPPIDVRGVVLDEKGQPLPGATVNIKGSRLSIVSDKNGKFHMPNVDDKAVLVISYVGYEEREVVVKEELTIQLKFKPADLQEVNVAYGRQEQRTLTGAVTVISGDQIRDLPNRSFDKSLQGLVPGLAVTSGSGQPGGFTSNFMLRGIATGGDVSESGLSRSPLIVIDGVPILQELSVRNGFDGNISSNPLAHFNPSDIETITVLKDASAIALYGSRASNGVILVTTKKGKNGKTQFNFRSQASIASRLEGKIDMLNQNEYLELLFESYRNSTPGITDAEILSDLTEIATPNTKPKFPSFNDQSGKLTFYPADDWGKTYYKNNSVTLVNELSASGGNGNSNFYFGLEYSSQNGVVKNTGFDRYSARLNFENRVAKWAKFGINTSVSYNVQSSSGQTGDSEILSISPLNPIYLPNGDFRYTYDWGTSLLGVPSANPIAASELNFNRNLSYRGLSKLYGEVKLLNDFTILSNVGIDFLLMENTQKFHPMLPFFQTLDFGGGIDFRNTRNTNLINTNLLKYNKQFGLYHNIDILLGQEAQVQTEMSSGIFRYGIKDFPLTEQANVGTLADGTSGKLKQTMLSYFSQLNYTYRKKYFLSGSIRTDGSSRFGSNERFGSYWSVGGGWLFSDENWFDEVKNVLNYMKLRGSFGPAGNSAAIADAYRYDRLARVDYLDGIALYPDIFSFPGNPNIQWEKTFSVNLGLDLRMINNRLSLGLDLYQRKTVGLISQQIKLPLATGFTSYNDNIGDVKNRGIELTCSADLIQGNMFSWNLMVNWSRNKNILTKAYLPLARMRSANMANEVGREYNSFYLPVWAGVNPENGRPTWFDKNGSKTENYSLAEFSFVGKAQADGFGSVNNSFRFKNWNLSAMIYYSYGSSIYFNNEILVNDGTNPFINQSKGALDRWRKPGDIASNPRRLLYGIAGDVSDNGSRPSTRYLFDGDFIRLSNVTLSYNLPKDLIKRFGLSDLRLSAQGNNLATWTKYSGQDPENINAYGSGGYLYPQQTTYSFTLNASF
ncbi:SusC/RagA family TonB-linked outer membrane protein [Pedobacter sp. KBW01]|uniref:SusC/RagA family TonB-linked outer membrane protein n=1 Tax=Pedobacter sp. KBW01 TaxID=2153364 RepID=UPI001319F93E|nr:SusC/RagA family TonB-linked outer membrane protein [Pedobacter sp. KBW01]